MAGTSGRFPAHATLAAAPAARPTEVACRLPTVASCKVRRSGEARGSVGGRGGRQPWRPGLPEYLSTWGPGRAGGRAAGQVARELPPSLKGGGSLALVLVPFPQERPCSPVLQCSYHLRPAGSAGLPGQPLGPPNRTKQPVNISVRGGSDPPFLVPSPVSSRTYGICCTRLFLFALPVSYRIMSRLSA